MSPTWMTLFGRKTVMLSQNSPSPLLGIAEQSLLIYEIPIHHCKVFTDSADSSMLLQTPAVHANMYD